VALPEFNGLNHWLEVSVHLVNSDREGVLKSEVFAVLGKERREVAVEGHVVTDHHPVSDSHRKAHRLVVRVPYADRKPVKLVIVRLRVRKGGIAKQLWVLDVVLTELLLLGSKIVASCFVAPISFM